MKYEIQIGQTDYTAQVKIRTDAGAPATGLDEGDIDIAYSRVETDNDVVSTDVTPAALTALTDAHTDWGFEEVSATDHPGLYRLDIADAVFASGAWSAVVTITGTGLDPADLEYFLVSHNPQTAAASAQTDLDTLTAPFDGTVGAHPTHGITDSGTAQSATATTLVLRAAATFADDTPIGSTLWAYGSDQGYWQSQPITDYVGATDTATVDGWTVTPTGTITYKVFGSAPGSGVAQTGDAYAIVASGTHGNAALKTLIDTIDTNVDDIETLLGLTDADVESILALLDNARGEPGQGAPPVNPDMATKVDYLYKFLRNKITQTADTMTVFADDGSTADHKSTVSDDGTTYTRGEIVSGA
jgi:hypothetical protein